jgi:hypothetical protein
MEFIDDSIEVLDELERYRDSFVMVEDGLHSGSFMFTKLLLKAVKGDGELVLVSTAHSLEHYESLLKRNSLDLRLEALAKRVTMRFLVPDGSLAQGIVGKEERARVAAANSHYSCCHCEWTEFEDWLKKKLADSGNNSSSSFLFVDDLSLFESLAPSKGAAKKLLFNLFNNLKHSACENMGISTFVAAAPIEVFPDEVVAMDDGEEAPLCEMAKYHANVNISILPLSTGFSNEVHGVVKYAACKDGQALKETFAFKVQNSNAVSFIRLKKEAV